MKNFALTGVAGYIAPRHLKAIKDTGHRLKAALDPHDSVGILDTYFQGTSFFTEFERFDRHLEKLRRTTPEDAIDYITICSPNHLHDAHIRLALRIGADAICEKPLVLNPWNLDQLHELEKESAKNIYTILQLRVHPSIIKLKEKIDAEKSSRRYKINLTYITSRGPWYRYSWKGNESKSGGIATNIGIHFFDMLLWLFGRVQSSALMLKQPDKMKGQLALEKADVEWRLSIDRNDLPNSTVDAGQSVYRSVTIDDEEIEFSHNFTDLHTDVYRNIFDGNGFTIEDARPSIELVYDIRNSKPK